MKADDSGCHLTYCSNIHPGERWEDVRQNLQRHLPAIRARVAGDGPFGLGLRLSARAAATLSEPGHLADFKAFLQHGNYYVFTLNGFPYGEFHAGRIKEAVYRPDWQQLQRLHYTNRLADLLAELLPADKAVSGSISTVPGAFKGDLHDDDAPLRIREHLVRHVAHLVRLRQQTGRHISLALEPEPCCMLETVAETIDYFHQQLHAKAAIAQLAALTRLDTAQAEQALHDHLGVCLDLCHAAVEYEDPASCAGQLADAGIGIFKMQVTAGLRLPRLSDDALARLQRFDDGIYLHQVVQSGPRGLTRFTDLPEAVESLGDDLAELEWRVHFHVPVFHDDLGALRSTQAFVRTALQAQRRRPLTTHLEVETYTWDVLPPALQAGDVDAAIARELNWVLDELRS